MTLSRRAFWKPGLAASWEELWDASEYFNRVSALLEDARRWVLIVGWQLDSRLLLSRNGRADAPLETLRNKVLRLCSERPHLHFYLLLWDHPTLYIPQREWLQTRVWEELHPRVHLVFDSRHPFGASHHEKLVEVDGRVTLTGSVDLCAERWDTPRHPPHDSRRSLDRRGEEYGPYHELAVQVTGPICRLLRQHIRHRWRRLSTIPLPDAPARRRQSNHGEGAYHRVWISRTRSAVDAGESHQPIVREVEFLFRELILEARHELWLEGQYFWSRHVQRALLERIERTGLVGRADEELSITILITDLSHLKFLPARMAWHQAHLLAELERAVRRRNSSMNGGRVSLRVFRPMSAHRPVYVHSKLLLVDDRFASIGSANFSARALRMDSELTLTFEARTSAERAHLRRLRRQVEQHWAPVSLVAVHSEAEEFCARRRAPILSRLAWRRLLDPELPYFHRFKRRVYLRFQRRTTRRLALTGAAATAWLVGFLPVGIFLVRQGANAGPMAWLLAALLFSVWILPVPFLALVLLASARLDADLAGWLVVWSWWMAGVVSIAWCRFFPTLQRRWTERRSPSPLRAFGRRRFSELIRAWADPRPTIHDKLLWQGRYWVPVPWIALVQGLFAAGALVWLVRWATGALAS